MLTVKGRITEQGELEAELPKGVQLGEVSVTIEYETPTPGPRDAETWTDEEVEQLLKPGQPMTSAEIVDMIRRYGKTEWSEIDDSVAWVEEQRRKHNRVSFE